MEQNLKEIGERIRQVRKEKGISQAELAEMVHISTPYLSDIEHGKKNYSVSILIALIESLQVSADWLLRADVPSTSGIQSIELASIFSDCTLAEKESLLHLLKETKSILKK